MVVLCDGMVRSGSTWSFNVALELMRSCGSDRNTLGFYTETPAVLRAVVRPRLWNLVIKSHNLDPSLYESCSSGVAKAIYTWRHPYDAIASAQRIFGNSVEHWIQALRHSLRLWSYHESTGSACIVPYESILRTPDKAIRGIAACLGFDLAPERARQIAEATSIERMRTLSRHVVELEPSRVVRKDGRVYDRRTLLHQNHIQDGRIGYGARLLGSERVREIDCVLREEGFAFLCESALRAAAIGT